MWLCVCSSPCYWTRVLVGLGNETDACEKQKFFLIIKPTISTNFLKFYFGMKLCIFRTVPLSIIRSFSPYTQQWCMSYRFVDSFWAGSGCNWAVMCVSITTSILPYFVSVAANKLIARNTLKYFYDKMLLLKSELNFIFLMSKGNM